MSDSQAVGNTPLRTHSSSKKQWSWRFGRVGVGFLRVKRVLGPFKPLCKASLSSWTSVCQDRITRTTHIHLSIYIYIYKYKIHMQTTSAWESFLVPSNDMHFACLWHYLTPAVHRFLCNAHKAPTWRLGEAEHVWCNDGLTQGLRGNLQKCLKNHVKSYEVSISWCLIGSWWPHSSVYTQPISPQPLMH